VNTQKQSTQHAILQRKYDCLRILESLVPMSHCIKRASSDPLTGISSPVITILPGKTALIPFIDLESNHHNTHNYTPSNTSSHAVRLSAEAVIGLVLSVTGLLLGVAAILQACLYDRRRGYSGYELWVMNTFADRCFLDRRGVAREM